MAGRFGPDERVAEQGTTDLCAEVLALTGMMQWFCAVVSTVFCSMAYAVGTSNHSGFGQPAGCPYGPVPAREAAT